MFSKNKILLLLLLIGLILISSVSVVSAAMQIEGGAFSTDGGLEDLTYASIDVGSKYSGDQIIIQIWYSRDGSLLNDGNMVPKTVTSDGFINVKSADAYKYFPDNAEINIYDTKNNLLDSYEVDLSPSKGIQTFGVGDYDHTYIKGSGSTTSSSSSSNGSKHIDVTTSDTFFFYSTESLAADDGYYAAVVVDGTPYYLADSEYDELCHYSTAFASGFITQFQDTSTTQDVKVGHTRVATIETPGNPVGDFELKVDKKFSFDYKIGTVGLNKQAHIITNLDLDD